jgi:hypothetical protein
MRDMDMKLIDEILDDVYQRPTLQSSQILASAIASTCNSDVTINLFDVLSWLNTKNKARLWRLINVWEEPDYSCYELCEAIFYMRENNIID